MNLFINLLFSISMLSFPLEKKDNSLIFDPSDFQLKTLTVDGESFEVRAYEGIIYVANPVDEEFQQMNIYIPSAYFEGKSIGSYSAENAPIFFPNQVGGYMPGKPGSPDQNGFGRKKDEPSTIAVALSKGLVVASPGARGRTKASGKAPAVIVDLKAAVRYLKLNDLRMPGDAQKIISNGTSAGGAVSALLGATGNNPAYEPYLKELGAADVTDDIFAVSAYCPITNLDHADMAYEWQYGRITNYMSFNFESRTQEAKTLDDESMEVSAALAKEFPEYLNGLRLKDKNGNPLQLDQEGNGSFKELVKSYVIASAQKALSQGMDLSQHAWLTIQNGTVKDLDYEAYVVYMTRMKAPPAFDALSMRTPENQLFGDQEIDKKHFTEFSLKNSQVADAVLANPEIVWLMNPMNFIGTPNTDVASQWRIRHGSKDRDTSLAIPVMLTTLLQNQDFKVDFALPWDVPHSGDYDLEDLFQWISEL